MNIGRILITVIVAVALFSCKSDKAYINGKFAGVKNKTIILEEMTPNAIIQIDSTETNDVGKFELSYDFENKTPVFLRVRCDNDYIILIASPGEKIELNSMLNLSNNYLVSGSENSELIKDLNTKLSKSFDKISLLTEEYKYAINSDKKEKISYAISDCYVKQKQENIKFIVKNSSSLASIVSLYQVFPNGVSIFGDNKDLIYFKLVSDTLYAKYPNSAYVIGLKNSIKEHENRNSLNKLISSAIINNLEVGYPNISLPNQSGEIKHLTDLDGKVIIVVMWDPTQKSVAFLNSELKEIYDIYSKKGLEIYQITLSENTPSWLKMIENQSIPWISVNDKSGLNSVLIKTYNIQSLPSNYIINRKGDIVGKNLWGNDLVLKLNNLL